MQHRVAFRRLLEDEFGDASVIEQQREIEPGPRLHEVQVAGGLLVALGEREQKVVVADLDLGRAQRFGSGRIELSRLRQADVLEPVERRAPP